MSLLGTELLNLGTSFFLKAAHEAYVCKLYLTCLGFGKSELTFTLHTF